jgi:GNAT superfamily N-acetyltransferase
MSIQVVPFEEKHLEDAAALLATRHRADRKSEPELPSRFEDPAATLELLKRIMNSPGRGPGVAAIGEGRLAGYLLSSFALEGPTPRAAHVLLGGHAVDPADGGEIYRDMYAAIAPEWLDNGCFSHQVSLPAHDRVALDSWFSLGFGEQSVSTSRSIATPAPGVPAQVEIRRAVAKDIGSVMRLDREFGYYFTASPMLLPYAAFVNPQAAQVKWEKLIANPDSRCWLALQGDQAIAFINLIPGPLPPLLSSEKMIRLEDAFATEGARHGGIGTALLNYALDWALSQGYERCFSSFVSTNIIARRFWLGRGFRIIGHHLERRIDERIVWAGPLGTRLGKERSAC